jgi:hypothetical protein
MLSKCFTAETESPCFPGWSWVYVLAKTAPQVAFEFFSLLPPKRLGLQALATMSIFFSGVGLGFELKTSKLQSKCFTAWATLQAPISIFFSVLGLELRAYTLSHSTSPFLWRVFWDRVSKTICPGWLHTTILLISASWVARITDMSHRCQAPMSIFVFLQFLQPIFTNFFFNFWCWEVNPEPSAC